MDHCFMRLSFSAAINNRYMTNVTKYRDIHQMCSRLPVCIIKGTETAFVRTGTGTDAGLCNVQTREEMGR